MQLVSYIITKSVYCLLVALQYIMLARAVLQWVMPEEDNNLVRFTDAVTEPVVYPVRMLLEKFEFFRNMPIDVSFFVAFLFVSILSTVLPATIS